jgi:uncharacterized protein
MSQPGVIDGLQFARGAVRLKGTLVLSQLQRLAEMRCAVTGLAYELSGRTDAEGRCWIRVRASGGVTLECQRCLGPLDFPLMLDSELLLTQDEREMANAEDDVDRVLAGRQMEVSKLVEDEVLLALPMAPMHGHCGDRQEGTESGRPSPFAALAKLKGIH